MPTIDVAMARSLRGGVWTTLKEGIVNGIVHDMVERNIVDDTTGKISDVQKAFSSWDNCMAVAYCKWPVIAVIAIGGLIIIGVLWCIIRCACCGVACCCSCFRCFKCCGNCCGCCDPPGGRPHKYLDDPYSNGPNQQGYRTEAPMQASFPAVAPRSEPPQYAEFDVSKKGGEDSLPAMPSWEGAGSKKVGHEEVELENLKKSPTSATDPNMPLIGGPSSGLSSPMPMDAPSPYGQPHGNHNGYSSARSPMDPYSPQDQGYGYSSNNTHTPLNNRESIGFGLDQPYDTPDPAPVTAMAAVPGRNSPAPSNHSFGRNPMDQAYGQMPITPDERGGAYGQSNSRGPRGMPQGHPQRPPQGPNGYGMRRQGTGESMGSRGSPAPPGMDPRMRNSPGPRQTPRPRGDQPYGQPPRQSPKPQNDYGFGQQGYNAPTESYNNSRSFSPAPERPYVAELAQPVPRNNYNNNRSFSPAPERQYAAELAQPAPRDNYNNNRSYSPGPKQQYAELPTPVPRPMAAPDSPITNNSGFDFTSGFARPQNDGRPSESREAPRKEAYPGYKPYQPAQEGWSGV